MLWLALVGAVAVVVATKVAGHFLPDRWLSSPTVAPTVALLTVALLSGLVAVQSFDGGHRLTLDARVGALGVAAFLLWRKAPFLVVVIAAAATAAGLRYLGWG